MEPRLFVGLEKNVSVAEGPISSVTPITKRMFPSARRALSKSVKIPHVKKSAPPKVKAAPNSMNIFLEEEGEGRARSGEHQLIERDVWKKKRKNRVVVSS